MPNLTLAALAQRFVRAGAQTPAAERRGLDAAGEIVAGAAKGMLGEYQLASPPFPRWADLKDSTIRDRLRHGFTANDPLLRSGNLRDSIGAAVTGNTVTIGTHDPKAGFLEHGTSRMPPRPFIGPAMMQKLDEAGDAIARHALAPLDGRMD